MICSRVAQLVEHPTDNRKVASSNLAPATKVYIMEKPGKKESQLRLFGDSPIMGDDFKEEKDECDIPDRVDLFNCFSRRFYDSSRLLGD